MDLERLWRLVEREGAIRNLALSVLIVIAVALCRTAARRWVQRTQWPTERIKLRWTLMVRNASWLLGLLGLAIVWASELRTFALSLVALGAAFVLATKELLLCLMGGVLRATARSYAVGDRIEIGGQRGDVVDYGLLSTTLLEIGPGHKWTGRSLVVPNSVLFTGGVVNETFGGDFVLHVTEVPLARPEDWRAAEQALLAAAREVCDEFIEEAKRYVQARTSEYGLRSPVVEPTTSVELPEAGRVRLRLRIPTPARTKGDVEQKVLRRFLDLYPAACAGAGAGGGAPAGG
jgi:small-conductance mechanosensitive channel